MCLKLYITRYRVSIWMKESAWVWTSPSVIWTGSFLLTPNCGVFILYFSILSTGCIECYFWKETFIVAAFILSSPLIVCGLLKQVDINKVIFNRRLFAISWKLYCYLDYILRLYSDILYFSKKSNRYGFKVLVFSLVSFD